MNDDPHSTGESEELRQKLGSRVPALPPHVKPAKPLNFRLPQTPEECARYDQCAREVMRQEMLRGSTIWTDD